MTEPMGPWFSESPQRRMAVSYATEDLRDYLAATAEGLPVDDDRGPVLTLLVLGEVAQLVQSRISSWFDGFRSPLPVRGPGPARGARPGR